MERCLETRLPLLEIVLVTCLLRLPSSSKLSPALVLNLTTALGRFPPAMTPTRLLASLLLHRDAVLETILTRLTPKGLTELSRWSLACEEPRCMLLISMISGWLCIPTLQPAWSWSSMLRLGTSRVSVLPSLPLFRTRRLSLVPLTI